MKKRERGPEELGSQWLNAMCDVLIGGALAGVTAILALLLCAVGAVTGGTFAVRRVSGPSLPVGLGVGAVLFLLLITAGSIAYEGASIANGGAGILCACLCGGAIPGLLARKPKKKRRR